MSDVTLMLGDCLERMKEIESASVDLILADPPYGTTACKWDSIIDLEKMWEQLKRVIKPNGAIVLTCSQPFTSILTVSNLEMYKYTWIWEKNRCGNYMAAKYQPLKYHEDVLVFSTGGINTKAKHPVPYNLHKTTECNKHIKSSNILAEGINTYHCLGKERIQTKTNYPRTIIHFDADKTKLHPTQKPVELMEYFIKTYTNEGETVLDFTMGSGTTGVACVNTDRSFIGIEMDEGYFTIATKRINDAKETK